jgi:hypothetical protein
VLEIVPKPGEPYDPEGVAKLGVFVMLKLSARNCSLAFSVKSKYLNIERLTERWCGP